MIIVGIDYSEGCAEAAALAIRWADQRGEPSRLIHVDAPHAGGTRDRPDEWLTRMGLAERDVEVRRGVPWIELVRVASLGGATLVVAGTHGRSGFQPLRLGRTAELLALRSPSPVLLVPPIRQSQPSAEPTPITTLLEESK